MIGTEGMGAMVAGKYIVESVPGVGLILLLGWAILTNHGEAGVGFQEPLSQYGVTDTESAGDRALEMIGSLDVSFSDQFDVMLEAASGSLCVTTRLKRAGKPGGSL